MDNKNKTDQYSKPSQEEEVDLGNLFIVIGKGIKNFFTFIGNIFKNVFHYFILLLIFLRNHALKLGLSLLIGFIIGFILHKMEPRSYVSNLIIETNYGSGIQLYKQIDYLNDLMRKKDTVSLSKTLDIGIEEASQIKGIEVSAYQAEMNLYRAYDEYMQETDTIYTKGFRFEDFKKRMAEYDLQFHDIEVTSKSKTVFANLSPSLISLVENDYYKNVKTLKVNELKLKLNILNKNLQQIDSLRNTYKEVALKEAENRIGTSTIEIARTDNKKEENDIKLFETSDNILEGITEINNDLIRKNNIINIISDFDQIGVPDKKITHKKYFQYAILFFGLMLGWILLRILNNKLEHYKKS